MHCFKTGGVVVNNMKKHVRRTSNNNKNNIAKHNQDGRGLIMRKGILLLSAGAAALVTPAYAQDNRGNPPVTQNSSPTSYDTNAIIVTATRRASPLSDVPIAVSAVTGESLRNSGASDIRQSSEEHTSELQSLMSISYAVFCLKKKTTHLLQT